jgi:hypothetical protein
LVENDVEGKDSIGVPENNAASETLVWIVLTLIASIYT